MENTIWRRGESSHSLLNHWWHKEFMPQGKGKRLFEVHLCLILTVKYAAKLLKVRLPSVSCKIMLEQSSKHVFSTDSYNHSVLLSKGTHLDQIGWVTQGQTQPTFRCRYAWGLQWSDYLLSWVDRIFTRHWCWNCCTWTKLLYRFKWNKWCVRSWGKETRIHMESGLVWIPAAPAEPGRHWLQPWLLRTRVIIFARRLMKDKLQGADFSKFKVLLSKTNPSPTAP